MTPWGILLLNRLTPPLPIPPHPQVQSSNIWGVSGQKQVYLPDCNSTGNSFSTDRIQYWGLLLKCVLGVRDVLLCPFLVGNSSVTNQMQNIVPTISQRIVIFFLIMFLSAKTYDRRFSKNTKMSICFFRFFGDSAFILF